MKKLFEKSIINLLTKYHKPSSSLVGDRTVKHFEFRERFRTSRNDRIRVFNFRFNIFAMLFAVLALAGCGAPSAQRSFHLSQDIDLSTIKKLAVLPLDNLTNDKYAGDIVRHVVVNELLLSGVVDVSMPGDAMAAAEKAGVRTASTMSEEQIRKIGTALKVQAVLFGAVEKYGEVRSGTFTAPEVAVTLMMADTQTGSIIWSVTRSVVGDNFMARHFGARAETLSETTIKVVKEAIQTMKTE